MNHAVTGCLLVGLGGMVGSVSRYGLSLLSQRFASDWPLGTWVANLLGCFFIGAIMEVSTRGETLTPEARLLLATGFCGGFTTMSSMIYETAQMMRAAEYLHAAVYVGATFVLSMVAFFLGVAASRFAMKGAGGLWS